MQIYGKGDYNIPSIKRAIIRYMLASTQTKSAAVASTTVTGTASGAGRPADPRPAILRTTSPTSMSSAASGTWTNCGSAIPKRSKKPSGSSS